MEFYKSRVFDPNVLAKKLQLGSAGLMPTDTLPALISSVKHAHKLWRIKKRPLTKPLILMGANPDVLFRSVLPAALEDAWEMSRKYWPGALTLVLPTSGEMLNLLNHDSDSLGMRIPNCHMSIAFLKQTGPIATTSANVSGLPPSLSLEQASKTFPALPILGPVPWPPSSGLPSTVLSWQKQGSWKVLREGAVALEAL